MNSSVDYVNLFNDVSVVQQWPNEVLQINLNEYTHAAPVTATANFYRPGTANIRDASDNHFNYQLAGTTYSLANATNYVISANNYPDSWGNKLLWDVARDDERGNLYIKYLHPAAGYNDTWYSWASTVFASRVIPKIINFTSTSIEISSVQALPFIVNYAIDALPPVGSPAAVSRGITSIDYSTPFDVRFPIQEYSRLALSSIPLASPFVHLKYLSAAKIESDVYVITNTTGSAITTLTATLPHAPAITGTVLALVDYNPATLFSSRSIRDNSGSGVFAWQDNSGLYAPTSTPDSTIDYTTGALSIVYNPPLYLLPSMQCVVSYDYTVASVGSHVVADQATAINHKMPSLNRMSVFLDASASDWITLSAINLPIYMLDFNVEISAFYTPGSVTSTAPSCVGYTVSFIPTASIVPANSNVIHISGGFTPNWYSSGAFAGLVDPWSVVKYTIDTDIPVGISFHTANGATYDAIASPWVAGTQYLVISSAPDFKRTKGTVTVTISGIDGITHSSTHDWLINADNIYVNPVITRSNEAEALVDATVADYAMADTDLIIWNVTPIDNIVIKSAINGTVINPNTTVAWSTAKSISVQNLGVEMTSFCLSTVSPVNQGCAIWNPAVYTDFRLQITAAQSQFNNRGEIRTLPLTASLFKRGLQYPIPNGVNLTWVVSAPANVQAYGLDAANSTVQFNVATTPISSSTITACFVPPTVFANPASHTASIYAIAEASYLSVTSVPAPTLFVNVDDFPAVSLLSVSVSSVAGSVTQSITSFSSTRNYDIFVEGLSANLIFEDTSITHGSLAREPITNRKWSIVSNEGNITVLPTTAAMINLTLAASSDSVSAVMLQVDYFSDTWKNLHTASLPIYVHFVTALPSISAIAIPKTVWTPDPVDITLSTYTLTRGVSTYGNCHNEMVTISATPSFDAYQYWFGDITTISNSPTASYVLACPLAEVTYTLAVMGYVANSIPVGTPSTYFDLSGNAHQLPCKLETGSDTSNKYWHNMLFVDYSRPLLTVTSNDVPIFPIGNLDKPTLSLTINVTGDSALRQVSTATHYDVQVFTKDRTDVTYQFSFDTSSPIGSSSVLTQFQTVDPLQPHFLSRYIRTPITVTITPAFAQVVDYTPNDWCTVTYGRTPTVVQLTACPLPTIDLFNSVRIGCVNVPIHITNATSDTISSLAYDMLRIDFGDGNVTNFAASAPVIVAQYTNPGNYFLSVSGIKNGNVESSQTFGPLVIQQSCGDTISEYNVKYTRQFDEVIELPYTCKDMIVANDWVTADVINSLIYKTITNLEYVIEKSTMYSPQLPYEYIGWFGMWPMSPQYKWNTNDDSKLQYTNQINKRWNDLAAIEWDARSNVIHLVHDGYITMHSYDADMSTIGSLDVASFSNARGATLVGKTLYIVDGATDGIYAYDSTPYGRKSYVPKQFFASTGTGNQQLIDPRDICTDGNMLYVADYGNNAVKSYNDSLAWISTIPIERPISVTHDGINLYVLSDNGNVTVIADTATTWSAKYSSDVKRIASYQGQRGFITIIGQTIDKYTTSGQYIGQFDQPAVAAVDCTHNDHLMMSITRDTVFLALDIISHDTIRVESADSLLWPTSAIMIDANQPVDAWVYTSSFKKLWDNIRIVNASIQQQFASYYDPAMAVQNRFAVFAAPSSARLEMSDYDQLVIGNNEIVSSHPIERAFSFMCNLITRIAERIKIQSSANVCNDVCWTWDALRGASTPHAISCKTNPLTWFELQSIMPTTFDKSWCAAVGCGCASVVTTPVSGL